jgi:hypothetical protein
MGITEKAIAAIWTSDWALCYTVLSGILSLHLLNVGKHKHSQMSRLDCTLDTTIGLQFIVSYSD